jgi:hypothetical protein
MRLALVLLVALALSAPAQGSTLLVLDSDAGDVLGQGMLRNFDTGDGTFTATKNINEGVSLTFAGSETWNFDFAAASLAPLAVGVYANAGQYSASNPPTPVMRVSGHGFACSTLEGSFVVHEITYGSGSAITAFAADFVQFCNGSPRRLVGTVRFNSSGGTLDVYDADSDGQIDIGDNCPAIANADQHDADLDFVGDVCDAETLGSFASFSGPSGEFISGGKRLHLNASNAAFRVFVDPINHGILVQADSPDLDSWLFEFGAPMGGALSIGVYENAQRYGVADPNDPGLNVSGAGRGCNMLAGKFEVFELELDPDNRVQKFSADFEQSCDGATSKLVGSVRWRAPYRAAPADVDGDGWLTKNDNCPGVPNPPQFDSDGDGRGDNCGLAPKQQSCVNAMNKGGAAIQKLQASTNLTCLKNAAKGSVDKLGMPATAQDCMSNDVAGKLAKSATGLVTQETKVCADPLQTPFFAYTSAAGIGATAQSEAKALMADVFGPDLDAALISSLADKVGAKCQADVATRANAAVATFWKLTLARKKAVLLGTKVLASTDADMLAQNLVDYLESDPSHAVSKPFTALATSAAKKCALVNLATAFPGCAPADVPALTACVERASRCRFCRELRDMDALAIDCDLFDDADTGNTSCAD